MRHNRVRLRISTSSVAREVDLCREAFSARYRRFVSSLQFLLIAVGHRRQVTLPVLILMGMSLHFAALQLGSLLVLGSLLLRLHSYRLANLILQGFR